MGVVFSSLLALLFAADTTLPNGIRIIEIPSAADSFEVIVGYGAGVRNEVGESSGLAAIVNQYLASTDAARTLALTAYGAGGDVQQISELDRSALRIRAPLWAQSTILDNVAAYLASMLDKDAALVARATASVLREASERDGFRDQVEDEIRIGLLEFHPYSHRPAGSPSDADRITESDVVRFFKENFGTNQAFVLMTGTVPESLKAKLAAIPQRSSRALPESSSRLLTAQRTLQFSSQDSTGAVILAAPVPGVYYREWYLFLLLDRLFRRVLPEQPETALTPALDPYYWRLEVRVPAGQFAENVRDTLMQDVERLQYVRAKPEDLEAARSEAREFLDGAYAQEWFASLGLSGRRTEGLQWLQSFTADDVRGAVRDMLVANRVTAFWSPKARETTVDIEPLNQKAIVSQATRPTAIDAPLSPIKAPAIPAHDRPEKAYAPAERLGSGVWLAASSTNAIFVSGRADDQLPYGVRRGGPNGELWKFDRPADLEVMRALQKYRADRILVFAPSASLSQAKALWSGFKPNMLDTTNVAPVGNVGNIDVPALLIMKAEIDRKLMESGWWSQASVSIDATHGATLYVDASAEIKRQIEQWIKAMASAPISEADFAWAREAALNHLNDALPDMQSLIWMRDPQYIMDGVETVSAPHVRDTARLYF